ncbi:transcriptional repressor [Patescibacteria group bacterium]|nr:transcriptional repressor [Patescibacteria group bacterium]
MTAANIRQASCSTTKHDCKKELNQVELRATPARLAVMKFLETIKTPVDVNTITDYLREHNIKTDPTTTFRIINSFTQKGLTRQLSFNEGKFRYELSAKEDHHHLICKSCGNIDNISDCAIPALEKGIEIKKKFKVTSHILEFFGICVNCQK